MSSSAGLGDDWGAATDPAPQAGSKGGWGWAVLGVLVVIALVAVLMVRDAEPAATPAQAATDGGGAPGDEEEKLDEAQDLAASRAAEQAALAAEQAALEAEQAALEAEEAARAAEAAGQDDEEAARQAQAAIEDAARLALAAEEAIRIAAELENARLAAEQAEANRRAAEQAEADRIAAEQAEADRIAAEQKEAARLAAIRHCEVGPWRDVGSCTPACRESIHTTATRRQVRDITQQPTADGNPCPALEQTRPCTLAEVPYCDRDCVENWTAWSECMPACRGSDEERSTQFRTRAGPPITLPIGGGRACDNSPVQERECPDVARCPIDCELSEWSEWSACSKPCRETEGDVVTRRRTRSIATQPAFGGEPCEGPLEEVEVCELPLCPPQDCEVSAWEPAGECSAACGPGTQKWMRKVTTPAMYGGAACPALEETRACEITPCPVDCEMEWGSWGACSKPCGGGTQSRSTRVKTAAAHGGKACPAIQSESRACNTQTCPTCLVSAWSAWSPDPCKFGTFVTIRMEQSRSRSLLPSGQQPAGCIAPALTEKRGCPQ